VTIVSVSARSLDAELAPTSSLASATSIIHISRRTADESTIVIWVAPPCVVAYQISPVVPAAT
jgi:hypothetical protein